MSESNGHSRPSQSPFPKEAWPDHPWFAALYDLFGRLAPRALEDTRRRVVAGARGRVLEIGAGTGANLPYYDWPNVESLIVSEPDHNMLQRLKTKVEHLPEPQRAKVRLHWAPAEDLDLEPGLAFDTIVSTLVLCTVNDPARVLREANRLIAPAGELRLWEHVAADGGTGTFQQIIQPVYGRLSAGCQLHRHTEDSLRAAGFSLTVDERPNLSPFMPSFAGTATK